MIKLNNKNITYVALADSNNSVKGVKEIWYADSNNSVKLVYRRKDALIEGEDYEKYHWLKTTGYAYINTRVKGNQDSNIEVIAIQYTEPTSHSLTLYGSIPSDVNEAISFNVGIASSSYRNTRFGNRVLPLRNLDLNQEYDVVQNKDALIVNGSTLSNVQATNNFESGEIYVFALNVNGDNTIYLDRELSIRKFVINDTINLIPCKLLKPIPKWLDANGIRRQVGECGMIDLISGKFYGNVNSVGAFTVENYYERKEWLQGDYVAYIDTNVIVNVATLLISTKIHRSNSTGNSFIFGSRDIVNINDPSTSSVVVSPQSFRCDIIDGNNIFDSSSIASIELSFPTITINGQSLTTQRVPTMSQNTFRIFTTSVVNSGTYCFNGGISGFVLNDGSHSLNLIPCTLTMDLPASMDANNIARTKGMSGMWDLVSDRFYGNVANSGTFKAVNLAEGVDYEVHQWLKTGSGHPHIQVAYDYNTDSGAYIETRYKCNYSNRGLDMFIGFSINQNNNIGIRIFNAENKTFVDHHKTENGVLSSSRIIKSQSNINAERYIKATLNNLIIDDTEYPTINWGSGFDAIDRRGTILHTNQGDNDVHYAETKLRVNNVEYDLIPVKLLRSIPSKYDANGIARQAGECGMYDTVNDLFYGNVASSGTFSVSDDE